jgi:uncharacterized protein (TIGR03083 family)
MSTQERDRFPEVEAVTEAVDACKPQAATRCAYWTVHDLTAHLVAGADEIARHVAAFVDQEPIPPTRLLEEREAPWRAMPDAELRKKLESALARLTTLLGRVNDLQTATIPWAGREVPLSFFATHVRSEAAIHRWDLVGDDDTNNALLTNPTLTTHAVEALGPLLLLRGSLAGSRAVRARFRTPGQPDVIIDAEDGAPRLTLCESDPDQPAIASDAAARLLLLWGRQPSDASRITTSLRDEDYAAARQLLAGY